MLRRNLARLLLTAAVTLGISAAAGVPASAHKVYGSWSDNDQLCAVSTCVNTGNLVRLWQTILYAEKLLPQADIDGEFGSQSANATINWQKQYNSNRPAGAPTIDVDGWVGSQSWNGAERRLKYETYDATYDYYNYAGVTGERVVNLRKNKSTGEWFFQKPLNMTWYDTSHGS
ncbi:MAG: hypothetical protein HOV71_28145 [Hamadaea sp.]|uniref:peptidoglycan-binding domain-containing protein n=1 Tax=Hamadaea sp. NPDC050747 TaxID=3155789 RepID=UPI0017FA8871|nr:hypothetical protein [Hamadaea sp.]NUR52015.1 hypothetical protein [Hamadaea sp.]NUT08304.1 hypothetical protein [Hamadaea sp.]